MATSGNINAIDTRNDIIRAALRITGILAESESPSSEQISDATKSLNRMLKAFVNKGLHIWKNAEATLFLGNGQSKYTLGSGATDHCTETYVSDELAVAAVATDLTITLSDATGISSGDYIGIVLDDDTLQWTTVNGAPVANVVTLTDAITGDAAIGNVVYAYTKKIDRPDKITDARRRMSTGIDIPLIIESRAGYFGLSNKSSTGNTTQLYYDKQRLSGNIYIWPTPSDVNDIITFTYQKPFDIFDSAADDIDFPQEYQEAVVYNLAFRMAVEYGVPSDTIQMIKGMADEYLADAMMYDKEDTPVFVQPNMNSYGSYGGTDGTD